MRQFVEQTVTLTTTSSADVLAALAAASSSIAVNGQKITGLGTPTADTDAATKAYVDAVAVGLIDPKASCRAATTANITLSGTQTIDGVSVIALDRVLVKNQSTGAQNGIYVCAAGAWARATDADISAEVTTGLFTFIEEGSTNADSGWVLTTDAPITLGTTALTFVKFSSIGGDFVGPASSTDNTIVRFDGTGGKTGQGSLVTLSDADLLEIPNTSGAGLALHNTADKGTNFERLFIGPSANVFYCQVEKGGTGTARNIIVGAGTGGGNATFSALGVNLALSGSSTGGAGAFTGTVTSGANPLLHVTNSGNWSNTSLVQAALSITGTVNQTSGSGGFTALLINPTLTAVGSTGAHLIDCQTASTSRFRVSSLGALIVGAAIAPQAGGTRFLGLGNTTVGIFMGSGAPTTSATKGSLYLRTDGSGTNDRMYVNTDGGTTWTALVTVA